MDLLPYQSFERELTRLVLQLPLPLLTAPAATSLAFTRVETRPAEVEVSTEGGSVVCRIRTEE